MSSATIEMGRMGWGVMIAGTFLMMPDRGRARRRALSRRTLGVRRAAAPSLGRPIPAPSPA
jgi:hypothetical protein